MAKLNRRKIDKFLDIFLSTKIHVMFNTTYYCDLMCPHCHYSCDTESKKFMPENDVYEILSELYKNNFLISGMNFSGGEITNIEETNPGYVKRVLNQSLSNGFYTTLMTNGSFIKKPYGEQLVNDLCDVYKTSNNNFDIQMSFDQYHKKCVSNAHKLIDALDEKLENNNGIKYPFYLTGFKHDPKFKNKLTVKPKNIDVYNKLAWGLNPIGRAKENNLPYAYDTNQDFLKWCNGDKLKQMIFTPLYPTTDGEFCKIMIFDCNGYVNLADAHNPQNSDKFKTTYKKPNGTFKTLHEIDSELVIQLMKNFYPNTKQI